MGKADNLQYQKNNHDGACKTDPFHTCAALNVSLDKEHISSLSFEQYFTDIEVRHPP